MDGTNEFSHIKQQIGERIVCQNVDVPKKRLPIGELDGGKGGGC